MNATLVILITQTLLKYGPAAAREIVLLFQKDNPTIEDWQKVFTLCDKPYETFAPPIPMTTYDCGNCTVTVSTLANV